MRDGARLKADVFRPKSAGRFPVVINLGAYQKDKLWVPPADLEEEPNEYMNWETVNPLWWVPRGYVAVRVDGRGSGKSPGRTDPWSPSESRDFYDAIEWAARQPWSNGRVGTNGISYYAMTPAGFRHRLFLHALAVGVHAQQPRRGMVAGSQGPMGEHRRSSLQRRQLERHGIASAR